MHLQIFALTYALLGLFCSVQKCLVYQRSCSHRPQNHQRAVLLRTVAYRRPIASNCPEQEYGFRMPQNRVILEQSGNQRSYLSDGKLKHKCQLKAEVNPNRPLVTANTRHVGWKPEWTPGYPYPGAPPYPAGSWSQPPAPCTDPHPDWTADNDNCTPPWYPSEQPPGWQAPPWTWSAPSHCAGSLQWVPGSHGNVPPGAVHGGVDVNGMPIFVGRAWHHGDLLPAKITPAHRCSFVTYRGKQREENHYEVLLSSHIAWRPSRGGGAIPPEAIRVGHTKDGEPLYVGRTMHCGTLTPGKVHPSHGCLYIAWAGDELKYYDYEIMVLD